jgi:mannose-6-phosphate isomerase-like protein (cupin superfamily)
MHRNGQAVLPILLHEDSTMIERIVCQEKELALIIRSSYHKDGIEFFTPGTYSQQVGYMNRPSGYVIPPHVHNAVPREVQYTKEVLFIRSGRVRVDFYSEATVYLESTILEAGDVILLAYGGHGFEMLEPTEIIEVKQGPYAGDHDKTRFEPISADQVKLKSDTP